MVCANIKEAQRYRIALILALLPYPSSAADPSTSIDFGRQVRPILSDRCFHCHGPDASNQKSDLCFDTEENALADLGGYFAIVPGKLHDSELHHRIHATDEDDLMPPADSNRTLSEAERALLDEWIRQGAPFDDHWAFKIPQEGSLPVAGESWTRNGIDNFIHRRLKNEGLSPSKEAEPLPLLRRASLDLTGLPPSEEALTAFLSDDAPGTYERAVDGLLASPQYGERMALPWLDASRYADSAGYQNDFKRSQWPWRD